jgi:hypothetical protein
LLKRNARNRIDIALAQIEHEPSLVAFSSAFSLISRALSSFKRCIGETRPGSSVPIAPLSIVSRRG